MTNMTKEEIWAMHYGIKTEEMNSEKGKYVICGINKAGNRMKLVKFYAYDGIPSLYIIADKNIDHVTGEELWICSLNRFTTDKKGNPILVVHPEWRMSDDSLSEYNGLWKLLIKDSGLFVKFIYKDLRYSDTYNIANMANSLLPKDERTGGVNEVLSCLYELIKAGDILQKDAVESLKWKEEDEILAEQIVKAQKTHDFIRFPEIVLAKAPNKEVFETIRVKDVKEWIQRQNQSYDKLSLGKETDLLKRITAVLEYRKEQREKEKEEKKEARKNKKRKTKQIIN